MIRTKHFVLQTGYQIWCDLEAGFTVGLFARKAPKGEFQYKFVLGVGWNWRPTVTYRDPNWHVNEAGMLQGIPIRRSIPLKRRQIAGIRWERAARWSWHG